MGGGGPSGSTSQNYYVDVDVLGKVNIGSVYLE